MITMATEEDDFERQLQLEKEEQYKQEQGYTYTDPNDGTVYDWDTEKQAWFPKVINLIWPSKKID